MQTATVVPTPWWRRLLRFFQRRVRPAGHRPKRRAGLLTLRGVLTLIRRLLIVAALLLGLLYAVSPSLRSTVNDWVQGLGNDVESRISPEQVRPTLTESTAQLPEHPATLATDGFSNTYWVAPDAAARPTLVLGFDQPTDLERAIIRGGGGEDFQALGRPRDLHLVYYNGQTVLGTSDVSLQDVPDPQQVDLGGGDGATRVEIQVMSYYRAVTSPALALSEIELFERPENR